MTVFLRIFLSLVKCYDTCVKTNDDEYWGQGVGGGGDSFEPMEKVTWGKMVSTNVLI